MNIQQLRAGQTVRVRFSTPNNSGDAAALPGIVLEIYPHLERVRVCVEMPSGKATPCHVHPDSIVAGVA